MQEIKSLTEKVMQNIEKVIVGKHEEVKLVLVSLLCEGHLLVEDVPGVGKTMLARSIARSLGCSFARIQFTPDLLPSDIAGITMFNQKKGDFEFKPGPVFNQIVLADEINRATPKTQSALLECMEEKQATIDGVTRRLPIPFLVIATQNPIEYEGTFPLPEAQLDRFLLRLNLGYPSFEAENEILIQQQIRHPIEDISQVVDAESLKEMQKKVKEVHVEQGIREYIVSLVQETRKDAHLYLGASPRGSLALFKCAQAVAAMEGRDYVIPDDVKIIAVGALAHRMISRSDGVMGKASIEILKEILQKVPVPQ
ncbi:MAG: MoxR family ATPase [Firmicutes bacterium]|nr:MoxR family ATPase [Bacillota bacterium]